MSDTTKIQWADATWNPWLGCEKVSPGCKNCYITTTTPFRTRKLKHGDPRERTSESYWKQPLKWNRDPRFGMNCQKMRVFPSLCDWLDDEVPIEWLADFLKLIYDTPNLDWLLLTKRPENFTKLIIRAAMSIPENKDGYDEMIYMVGKWPDQPPANVWFGVSVEDQIRADQRIPQLLAIPARVRFLSVEPLLGPVNLRLDDAWVQLARVPSWIIVGGESGPKARPCDVAWIHDIVRQCKAATVPAFVKQLGSKPVSRCVLQDGVEQRIKHPKGGDPSEWPEALRVRQFPS